LPSHSNFANGCFFHFAASARSSLSPEQSASRRALRYDRRAEDRKVSRWIQEAEAIRERCYEEIRARICRDHLLAGGSSDDRTTREARAASEMKRE